MFNHPTKGWSLGLLYDVPAVPEHLKIFLTNNTGFHVRDLVQWLYEHNVRGVAYCAGNWIERIRSRRFIRQFNDGMEGRGMLADLGEFYRAVMGE